jgi:hypothetical protein
MAVKLKFAVWSDQVNVEHKSTRVDLRQNDTVLFAYVFG